MFTKFKLEEEGVKCAFFTLDWEHKQNPMSSWLNPHGEVGD